MAVLAFPHRQIPGWTIVQRVARLKICLGGTGKRHNQVQLRSCSQHKSDATQYAIHLPIGAEAIEIHRWYMRSLPGQLFVGHAAPREFAAALWRGSGTAHNQELCQAKCSTVDSTTKNYIHPGEYILQLKKQARQAIC